MASAPPLAPMRPTPVRSTAARRKRAAALPRLSATERAALRRRIQALGLTIPELTALMDLPANHLYHLLDGTFRTSRRLGYDRWAETVHAFLDQYEQALSIYLTHLQAAETALAAEALPVPPPLSAWREATARILRSLAARAPKEVTA